jgi:hypothetical protein
MEEKVTELAEVLMNLFDIVDRFNVRLEELCLKVEKAHQHITSLEMRMEGLNEELEDSRSDKPEESGIRRK